MTSSVPDGGLIRVQFELDPDEWHETAIERLWAEPIGSNRARLRNTPFYAFGVSFHDVVFIEDRDGQPTFASVSIRSGHSTYRLFLRSKDPSEFQRMWAPLEELGCSYEGGRVIAVDVPATADVCEAYRLLELGLDEGVWDFEEGHCGHPVEAQDSDEVDAESE